MEPLSAGRMGPAESCLRAGQEQREEEMYVDTRPSNDVIAQANSPGPSGCSAVVC